MPTRLESVGLVTERRQRVFLHIGAMKTGTTFLQGLMLANREDLTAAGYLFPGETWARQVRAVQDVIQRTARDTSIKAEAAGAWQALVAEMSDHRGPAAVMSVELLSFANAKEARRVVTSLEPAETHVVVTVRDATLTIPAQWQTNVHNGSTIAWGDFMRGVRKAAGVSGSLGQYSLNPARRSFSRAQGVDRILRTWGRIVSPARLHVITVPPPGSDRRLLWERFADVLGLDPGVCSKPPMRSNESLGYPSTELLRRVNQELGALRPTDYNPTLKEYLALRVLSRRSRGESRARIDRATCEFALAWNQQIRRAIVGSGAAVTGDLEDLPTTVQERHERVIDEVQAAPPESDILAAAVVAVEAMRKLVSRRAGRLRSRGIEVDLASRDSVANGPESWASSADPVSQAAAEIAALARTAIELRRRMRS